MVSRTASFCHCWQKTLYSHFWGNALLLTLPEYAGLTIKSVTLYKLYSPVPDFSSSLFICKITPWFFLLHSCSGIGDYNSVQFKWSFSDSISIPFSCFQMLQSLPFWSDNSPTLAQTSALSPWTWRQHMQRISSDSQQGSERSGNTCPVCACNCVWCCHSS